MGSRPSFVTIKLSPRRQPNGPIIILTRLLDKANLRIVGTSSKSYKTLNGGSCSATHIAPPDIFVPVHLLTPLNIFQRKMITRIAPHIQRTVFFQGTGSSMNDHPPLQLIPVIIFGFSNIRFSCCTLPLSASSCAFFIFSGSVTRS